MELSRADLLTGVERKPLTQGGELWLIPAAGANSVSVWWHTGNVGQNGHASAGDMFLGNGDWYVNRVVIKPETSRGQGIGGLMLEALKDLVARRGAKRLIV